MKLSWQWLKFWVWTLVDALPPYSRVEGPLEAKEMDPRGRHYILVESAWIEVDGATFDTLEMGERLRVRYTKGDRAINIDRLQPPDDLNQVE